jgi:hypothetical protein
MPDLVHAQVYPGFVPSGLMFRQSTKSRIVFDMFNDGSLFGTVRASETEWDMANWPRETFERVEYAWGGWDLSGFWFGCSKGGRNLVSSSAMATTAIIPPPLSPKLQIVNQFVPGFIGDPQAPADTAFAGVGWRYLDDPNYIIYLSTDYDSSGVDLSGTNFPDWPIRLVAGKEVYVQHPLDRHLYPAVVKSDEDFFSIYKDTDTRSDPEYVGANPTVGTASIPIGIEVRQHCYTWSTTLLRNAIVLLFEIHNKSGKPLNSCYVGTTLGFTSTADGYNASSWPQFAFDSERKFGQCYNNPALPSSVNPSGVDGRVGYALLESPKDLQGAPLGITFWKKPVYGPLLCDSVRYDWITKAPMIESVPWSTSFREGDPYAELAGLVFFGSGPFTMAPGDSVRMAVEVSCAIGSTQLFALHDYIKSVYANNLQFPSPPKQPTLSATPAEGSILLRWDDAAEHSLDPSVPDSLGKPFAGYRLYRSAGVGAPFVMIRQWTLGQDSLVHEYIDRGQDGKDPSIPLGRGLTDNVTYLYKLTAFDDGVSSLEIPEMESQGVVIQAVPSAAPSSPFALDQIRIVPNPYLVTHAAQKSIDQPNLFFNFLPEVCTIRIYTVALDLVAELHHQGGSAESWDLKAQGGQQVASQMFLALIETPQGTRVTKKFAVVIAN